MRGHRSALFFAASAMALSIVSTAHADMDAAKRWVEKEFQPSTLTKEQQLKEMEWFINAAKPYKGMEINVLSETIPTHEYESKTLAKAFEEITGIKVNHQVLGEGERRPQGSRFHHIRSSVVGGVERLWNGRPSYE